MENTFIVGNYQPGVCATIILPKMELVKNVFSRANQLKIELPYGIW